MNNILIKISSNLLTFSLTKKNNEDLNNTNIISTKELYFDLDYIKENIELVSSFLNTIIIKNNIDKVRIDNIIIVCLVLDLVNNSNIKKILISENKSINYDIFLKILNNQNLEYLNCYDIPPFLFERLNVNNANLKIDVRSEIFFLSKFMEDNKLYKYSDIYYKKNIVINSNFNPQELEDFKTFMRINNCLKEIHIKNYTNDLIYSIINIFKENNIKDKIIVFYENKNINIIVNSINYLKNIYKDYLESNNIDFKIVYSKEYKRKNMFKQINFVTLKYICFVLISGTLVFSGFDFYKNYSAKKKVDDINNSLTDILDDFEYTDDTETSDVEYIDTVENEQANNINYNSNYLDSYYATYSKMFEELAKINDETIGWITVNKTKVNYPVVQHTDNNYYLKHDFKKNNNAYGWIFMDYRNNIYNMSDNTILYGHNSVKDAMMFGSLRYTTNESWYKNSENQIITFNTKVKNMKWRIFSIYRIPVTNDYLYANFADRNEYQTFLNTLKGRSIYDFGVEVNSDDHILTLSTCGTSVAQRMVIHAVLIKE